MGLVGFVKCLWRLTACRANAVFKEEHSILTNALRPFAIYSPTYSGESMRHRKARHVLHVGMFENGTCITFLLVRALITGRFGS